MKKTNLFLLAVLFLIVSIIVSIGLIHLGRAFPGQEYYNPLGLLVGFGPLITSIVFILAIRDDKIHDLKLNKFNIQPLLRVIVVLILIYVSKYIFYFIFGIVEFRFEPKPFQLYNTDFGYLFYYLLAFLIPFVYTGIGEEFGWRGYLFNKLMGLKWLQFVFLLNGIWALWHIPVILYGIMEFNNFKIDFLLFTISTIEVGIILLYNEQPRCKQTGYQKRRS